MQRASLNGGLTIYHGHRYELRFDIISGSSSPRFIILCTVLAQLAVQPCLNSTRAL